MDLHDKDLKFLHKLRQKYADNEEAFDAIMYYALIMAPENPKMGVQQKLKHAIKFFSTPAGDDLYGRVHESLQSVDKDKKGQQDDDRDIYEYSHELAKAARHKEGVLSLKPGVIPPEYFAVDALSRFNQRI